VEQALEDTDDRELQERQEVVGLDNAAAREGLAGLRVVPPRAARPHQSGAVKVRVEIPLIRRCYVDLSRDNREGYEWIEKVVEKGLPDGRKRFILYALSAYLMNVKGLGEEEALQVVREFLENSRKNFGMRDEVYESFIRGDLKRVRSKGLRPATLEKVRRKDPELYSIIERVLSC
jgi:hypothetical protein